MGIVLTPEEIGLPGKFAGWRPGQDVAVDRVMDAFDEKRFVTVSAPVGAGKTVTYLAVAMAMGWRAAFITSTKGLQDQLLRDFTECGLVDVRGQNNFPCGMFAGEDVSCEIGAHAKCSLRRDDPYAATRCPYKMDVKQALASQFVTTNYKYWMLAHMYGEGLGRFDLLVLDEAHEAPEEVCGVMGVQFTVRELRRMLNVGFPHHGDEAPFEQWREWAQHLMGRVTVELQAAKAGGSMGGIHEARQVKAWESLANKITMVATSEGAWGVEGVKTHEGPGFRMEPIWPQQYAKKVLFRDVPHVLLTSATIRPKTMELLGLKPEEYDFQDYPYLFPRGRSPIYFIPTAWVQHDMTDGDRQLLESRVDQIIGKRLDRNGLIHSVSYRLRDQLTRWCEWGEFMMTHDQNSASTRDTVMRFKKEKPPAILCSPSINTGYDFPYKEAEYQIIPKLPFPVIFGSKIMEARCRKRKGGDPEYADYLMVQSLTQTLGRPMRAEDDRCETFILDNNFLWVKKKLRKHFPTWVHPLIRQMDYPPDPPSPLSAR